MITPKFVLSLLLAVSVSSNAVAGEKRSEIRVNSYVTTHIVMPENLKMVDISTPNIIGNQCADNMVRIKPTSLDSLSDKRQYYHDDFLGTITLIGERHIAQYDVIYDARAKSADSFFNVSYDDVERYSNPDVSMPESEMSNIAWAIYGSKKRFNNIHTRKHGIKAAIYNIYSIGNYFFIDFGMENKTNIPYSISEINVTLTDKKETKATNAQSIQVNPVFQLNPASSFNKNYRQVLVLDKLTFPDEKVVNITISENQISGRTITLALEYADVLHADGFDMSNIRNNSPVRFIKDDGFKGSGMKNNSNIEKQNSSLIQQLKEANKEITKLKDEKLKLENSMRKLEAAYKGANETISKILGN